MSGYKRDGSHVYEGLERLARAEEPRPADDWLESAERDYAWADYEFFGREWGEKLLEEVKRLRALSDAGGGL